MSRPIAAVGINLDSLEINQMVKTVAAVFPESRVRVIDIADETRANIDPTMEERLIIVFGKEAATKLWNMKLGIQTEAIPDASKLIDIEGNGKTREYAWNTLRDLKKRLDLDTREGQNKLSKESLPSISANDVLTIERLHPNGWTGRTKDGHTIRLSARPEEGSEDIRLTFAELFALKVAVELLEVTEFSLVPTNKTSHQ